MIQFADKNTARQGRDQISIMILAAFGLEYNP
jgi:hypothetical protein